MLVDAFLRFGGLALLLLLAFVAWQYGRDWKSRPYLILSCVSLAALFIGYAPSDLQPPEPLLSIARFVDIPNLVFVWLFALSLYQADFRLRAWHVAVGTLFAAPIFWPRLARLGVLDQPPDWLLVYGGITSVLLIGHVVWVALTERKDDLVERRRNSRHVFVVLLLLVTIAAAASELIPDGAAIDYRTAKIAAIWPALLFGTVWMLRLEVPKAVQSATMKPADIAPRDRKLLADLEDLMIEHERFRDPDLTIVALASDLGVTQHRLRDLINSHLGHANFSSFVNRLRVRFVCAALAVPDKSAVPILTLSMDAGFKSLSAFNKAFKSIMHMTPREYRAQQSLIDPSARNRSAFSRNTQDALYAGT